MLFFNGGSNGKLCFNDGCSEVNVGSRLQGHVNKGGSVSGDTCFSDCSVKRCAQGSCAFCSKSMSLRKAYRISGIFLARMCVQGRGVLRGFG